MLQKRQNVSFMNHLKVPFSTNKTGWSLSWVWHILCIFHLSIFCDMRCLYRGVVLMKQRGHASCFESYYMRNWYIWFLTSWVNWNRRGFTKVFWTPYRCDSSIIRSQYTLHHIHIRLVEIRSRDIITALTFARSLIEKVRSILVQIRQYFNIVSPVTSRLRNSNYFL